MGQQKYKEKLLDVRKDRLDLRDRAYQPILKSLPHSYPNVSNIDEIIKCYRKDNRVLDQGNNGACTGYALASIINYLLWTKAISDNEHNHVANPLEIKSEKVSPKMLFNLARIYDEWDGEDYEGSSCRGAMKGWHKHGVCREHSWKFDADEPKEGWDKESVEKPLGAYYRVDKNSIEDMQSAIYEVGALYVSAVIHDGWWEFVEQEAKEIKNIEADLPKIPYPSDFFPRGKHAFIIVGYTRYGFIVQNSWGESWGSCGFALLSYQDWLANGLDVWVAVMGVPIEIENTPQTYVSLSLTSVANEAVEGTKTIKKSLSYDYKKKIIKPVSEEQAYQHTLVLNSNGRAKHTIIYTSSLEKSMQVICYNNIKTWLNKSTENRKVAIYALGGLQNEKEYISKIRVMIPYFLQNGIYPILLTWQESFLEEIQKSIENFFQEARENNVLALKDELILQEKEALNRAIENYSKKISTRAIWAEVKEKSFNANLKKVDGFEEERSGTLYILTDALQRLNKECQGTIELHVMAHSAGSQLLVSTWLEALEKRGMKLSSMHLLAPTVSVQDANQYMIKAYEKGVFKKDKVYIYMLDTEMELADSVGKYRKSLLYLISRALEKIHKTPLLGLKDSWEKHNSMVEDGIFNTQQLDEIKKWLSFAYKVDKRYSRINLEILGKECSQLQCSVHNDSIKLSHKHLDSSIYILEKVLKVMVDGELKYTVENLG